MPHAYWMLCGADSQGLRNCRFLLVYTQGIAEFWKIHIKNCPGKRHIGKRQRKCEAWNFWFPLPWVSWAALCSQHRCASIEHLQARELTPGSVSRVFTGAPPRRHDWLSLQMISGSNLSRGAADITWLKPLSWITLFMWPKLFTPSHNICILIRLSQEPHINKSTFLSVNLWHL